MKTVEFDAAVSPDGTLRIPKHLFNEVSTEARFHVTLTELEPDVETRRQLLRETAGICRDDPSIGPIFEEIARARRTDFGREVNVP